MNKGDIVSDVMSNFYVVKESDGNFCSLLYLSFNSNRDSVIVKQLKDKPTYDYTPANESHINYAGMLAQVAEDIKAGKDIMIYD